MVPYQKIRFYQSVFYKMEFPIIVLFLGILRDCECLHSVAKRVINGVPYKGRPSAYSVIKYYGAITYTNNFIWNYLISWSYVKPTQVLCGGAFLTPAIFQTACHCASDYDANDARYLKPPLVRHNWENRMVIYPGVSNRFGDESFETYSYVIIRKFVVHSKCAGFGDRDSTSYDYALALLEDSWINRGGSYYPWKEIAFAPQYTAKVIQEFHRVAQQKQLVCLKVGFGKFIRDWGESSEKLRYGWGHLLTDQDCFYETRNLLRSGNLERSQRFSWVCTQDFPFHMQENGEGDSGGPVTCENVYIALVSATRKFLPPSGIPIFTDKQEAIVHTLYSNAIDYRSSFIRTVEDIPIFVNRRRLVQLEDGTSHNEESNDEFRSK